MRRFLQRLWPRSQTWRATIIAVSILVPIAVAFVAFVDDWSDVSRIKDAAGAIQSAVTVIAIVAGGIFALFKLQAFRDFEPHVDVVHDIRHRFMNDTYVHIDVRATLHNTSRVKIEFRRAQFSVLQVLPNSSDDIVRKRNQVFFEGESRDIKWPVLDFIEHEWDTSELIVEPGGKHSESQEFIVPIEDAETVRIDTFFFDPRYSQSSDGDDEFGWSATSFYDIVESQ